MQRFIVRLSESISSREIKERFLSSQTYQMLAFCLGSALVGVVAVVYSRWFASTEILARKILSNHPYVFVLCAPVLIGASSWLCRRFAPLAAGSGPEHVLSAIKRASMPGATVADLRERLGTRVSVVKIVSSLLCILGGGALGREGPVIQITAGVFMTLGRKLRRVMPDIDLQTWIIAGSAAGLAAAFNTPLGGVVYAIEELSELHFSRIRSATLAGVVAAGLTAQVLAGPYLLFGYPKVDWRYHEDLGPMLFVALVCGMAVVLFRRISRRWKHVLENTSNPMRKAVAIGSLGLGVGVLGFYIGPRSMGGGLDLIRGVLFDQTASAHVTAPEVGARFLNVLMSHVAGCAGGLLAPSFALGAGIGSAAHSLFTEANGNLLALAGMATFLGAMIKAPFTATVLVLEMTDRPMLAFPLMMSSLIGHALAQSFGKERVKPTAQ